MPDANQKALEIHALLVQEYGDRPWQPRADPLSELVGTVLSQNTSDLNSGRAYESLRAALPTWEAVRDAPVAQVEAAIRCGGLSAIKAPRIQRILAEITRQRGDLDLCFLDAMPVDEARRWLVALEGVGAKTAACVLMFALGKPVIPVDTHVHRVSRRLGLAGAKDSPERTEAVLEAQVPPAAPLRLSHQPDRPRPARLQGPAAAVRRVRAGLPLRLFRVGGRRCGTAAA